MKKLFFIGLCALMAAVNVPLSAAVHPDTWHTMASCCMNLEMGIYELWTFQLGNDTTIDGKTYASFRGKEKQEADWFFGPYLIRYAEDSTKVYVRVTSDMEMDNPDQMHLYMEGEDMLLYDYSAQKDDTVYTAVICGNSLYLAENIIDSTYWTDGRRTVKVSATWTSEYEENVWTEGLGGYSLIPNVCPGGSMHVILCALRGDELLYRMDEEMYRNYWERYGVPSPCHHVPVTTADTWYFLEQDWVEPKEGKGKYYLDGDTIFDGKQYRRLMHQGGLCEGPSFFGGLRQSNDGMQVYWYNVEDRVFERSNREYLLYDFSANIGDTIRNAFRDLQYVIFAYYDCVPDGVEIDPDLLVYIVRDKKVVDNRIVMTVGLYYLGIVYGDEPSKEPLHITTWIQGIGTPQVLWPRTFSNCSLSDLYAACVLKGDEILYTYNKGDCSDWDRSALLETRQDENYNGNATPYNILGQPVDETYHGIVIQNGQKRVQ